MTPIERMCPMPEDNAVYEESFGHVLITNVAIASAITVIGYVAGAIVQRAFKLDRR